ncbi:MAG: hypothetical protein Q8Q01_04420 [archaeon]|nr:hypothetical protein [archaeon]
MIEYHISTGVPYSKISEIKLLGFADGLIGKRQLTFIEGAPQSDIIALGRLYEAFFEKGRQKRPEIDDVARLF